MLKVSNDVFDALLHAVEFTEHQLAFDYFVGQYSTKALAPLVVVVVLFAVVMVVIVMRMRRLDVLFSRRTDPQQCCYVQPAMFGGMNLHFAWHLLVDSSRDLPKFPISRQTTRAESDRDQGPPRPVESLNQRFGQCEPGRFNQHVINFILLLDQPAQYRMKLLLHGATNATAGESIDRC